MQRAPLWLIGLVAAVATAALWVFGVLFGLGTICYVLEEMYHFDLPWLNQVESRKVLFLALAGLGIPLFAGIFWSMRRACGHDGRREEPAGT